MFIVFSILFLSFFSTSSCDNDIIQDEFEQECLKKINTYRARHGAPSLTLSPDLHQTAVNRALNFKGYDFLIEEQIKEPRDFPNIGENVEILDEDTNALDAIDKWYAQGNTLKPGSTGSKENKKFTQMIWKASTELGCFKLDSENMGRTYVVAHFRPKGNDRNTFAENIQVQGTSKTSDGTSGKSSGGSTHGSSVGSSGGSTASKSPGDSASNSGANSTGKSGGSTASKSPGDTAGSLKGKSGEGSASKSAADSASSSGGGSASKSAADSASSSGRNSGKDSAAKSAKNTGVSSSGNSVGGSAPNSGGSSNANSAQNSGSNSARNPDANSADSTATNLEKYPIHRKHASPRKTLTDMNDDDDDQQKHSNSNDGPSARGMGFKKKDKNEEAQDSNAAKVQTTLLNVFLTVTFIAVI